MTTPIRTIYIDTPAHLETDHGGWWNVFRVSTYSPDMDGGGGTFLEYLRDSGNGPEFEFSVEEVDSVAEARTILPEFEPEDFE